MAHKNWVGFVILILLGGAILFGRAMHAQFSHDEHQFIASAQLLISRGLLPYLDYPYFHLPNMVFINSLAVAASDHDFLAVRALGVVWSLGTAAAIYFLALSLLPPGSALLRQLSAFTLSLVMILDPLFILADGRAFNHMLPGLLSLLAFAACRQGLRAGAGWKWFGLCGVLSGLATGARASYAVVIVVFAAAIFLLPQARTWRARLVEAGVLGAGAFLSLLPTLALFLAAPERFYFGNYIYIRLNTLYRQAVDYKLAMNLPDKWLFLFQKVLLHPLDIFLYLALIAVTGMALVRWRRSRETSDPGALLAAGLGLALFASAFAPTPSWPQYFFAPLPFLVVVFVYGSSWLARRKAVYGYIAVGTLAALALASNAVAAVRDDLATLLQPDAWLTVEVHQFAEQLGEKVPEGKVLTLAPIFALEAGLEIYEPFTVGPFAWRTAHLVGAELRSAYGIVARRELDEYLAADPPAAVLVGFETEGAGFGPYDKGRLEKPMEDYARSSGFTPQAMQASFTLGTVILWTP